MRLVLESEKANTIFNSKLRGFLREFIREGAIACKNEMRRLGGGSLSAFAATALLAASVMDGCLNPDSANLLCLSAQFDEEVFCGET